MKSLETSLRSGLMNHAIFLLVMLFQEVVVCIVSLALLST